MTPLEVVAKLRDGDTVRVPKPTVPDVQPILDAYYGDNGAGGAVHIITDDYNLGGSFADWCLKNALENPMYEDDDVFMAWVLTQCSATQQGRLAKRVRPEGDFDYPKLFWEYAEAFLAGCSE